MQQIIDRKIAENKAYKREQINIFKPRRGK